MSTLRFCDCCGELKKDNTMFIGFEWLCHLTDISQGILSGFVDENGNTISGRSDAAELCIRCYNKIMVKSVKEYFELRKENKTSEKMENIK